MIVAVYPLIFLLKLIISALGFAFPIFETFSDSVTPVSGEGRVSFKNNVEKTALKCTSLTSG